MPPGTVTLIGPVVAAAGTVTVICVPEFTVNAGAFTPLKLTALAPVNPDPVIVTLLPDGPYAGENAITVKFVALVAVPDEVVTAIGPVVTPAGAVVVICVGEFTVNDELAPLNATLVVLEKFVPVIVTTVPAEPPLGVKLVIVGVTGVASVAIKVAPIGEPHPVQRS